MFEAPYQMSELAIELLGIQSLNPWVRNDSAARAAMASNHLTQSLPIVGGTIRRQQTGAECEYAKYTHKIAFPCDGIIVDVIRRYPVAIDMMNVESPNITVIYNAIDTNTLSMLDIPYYHSLHQYFGFKFVHTPIVDKLAKDMVVKKGTILAHSPTVTPSGRYKYGIEAQIAFMSMPTVIEDGIAITDRFAERCKTTAFVKRRIRFSDKDIPLNTNGTIGNYQIIPELGSKVRSDGLLFASRKLNVMTSPFDLLPVNLMRVGQHDDPVFGVPDATVVDITVIRQSHSKSTLPEAMFKQIDKYYRKNLSYYEQLLDVHRAEQKKRGTNEINIEPKLSNLLTRSTAYKANVPGKNSKVELVHGEGRIDEWEVEITLQYDIIPTIGYKYTDGHGCKGIVCDIIPWQHAPRDGAGNICDIISDAESPVNRSVMGRLFEHYTNASMFKTWQNVKAKVDGGAPLNEVMRYIRGFYEITSPTMLPFIDNPSFDVAHHVNCVYQYGLYIDAPPDANINMPKMIRMLQKHYPPEHGPVTFVDSNGITRVTKKNVLIGGVYVILLEKIGNLWSAVSSAPYGHYGSPAKISKSLKYVKPGRESAIRIFGEAETRLISAVISGWTVADQLDKTNSPRVHNYMCDVMLKAPNPSNITEIVDRREIPSGGGRPVNLAKSVVECSGLRFVTNRTCSRGQVCLI